MHDADADQPPKLTPWLLGIFATLIVLLGVWAGSNISTTATQLSLLAYRMGMVEDQLTILNDASRAGARFTAQDGVHLSEFVRSLEARIAKNEGRILRVEQFVEKGKSQP